MCQTCQISFFLFIKVSTILPCINIYIWYKGWYPDHASVLCIFPLFQSESKRRNTKLFHTNQGSICWADQDWILDYSNSSSLHCSEGSLPAIAGTRTTRTPVFWGYPPPPHDYPYHWVILDFKSKEDKVKVTNLKNSPKFTRDTPSEVAW